MDDFAGLGFEEMGRCGSMLVCGGVRRGERVGGCNLPVHGCSAEPSEGHTYSMAAILQLLWGSN